MSVSECSWDANSNNFLLSSFDLGNSENEGEYILPSPETLSNNYNFENGLKPESRDQIALNYSKPQSKIEISLNKLQCEPTIQIEIPFSEENRNQPKESQKRRKNSKSNQNTNMFGRKRKNSETKGNHTKFAEDNKIRKAKVMFKDSLFAKINEEIAKINENENLYIKINGKEYKLDKLLKINQKKTADTNVLSNRRLLAGKVKDLFSEDITGRNKNTPKSYNRIAINKLYEYGNEKIISIFETNYLNCIKFFRKDDKIYNDGKFAYLKGIEKKFERLQEDLKNNKKEQNYIRELIDVINNFEKIYAEKEPKIKDEN
jgi:hypothetical protein